MKNRESLYPGRVKLTPVDEANGIYDLVRADEPQEEGTPLNKALLDYAVAACGVTAGTATALTLDDAFGGFTLVDGAKVNFRLHVASGANPTLNVNGTGAKAIKTMRGIAMGAGVAKGTWVSARYSAENDCYAIQGDDAVLLKSVIAEDHTEFRVEIPGGYTVYRLHAAFAKGPNADTATTTVTIGADIEMYVASGGASYDEFINSSRTAPGAGTASTGVRLGATGGFVDITIIVKDNYTRISGVVGTSRGIAGVGADAEGVISYLAIGVGANSPMADTFVMLEGIA